MAHGNKAKLKRKNAPDAGGGGNAHFYTVFLGEGVSRTSSDVSSLRLSRFALK
jgi:hypothetical protein